MRLAEGEAALGRLAGAGRLLPEPQLLVGPYLRREAVASTGIEGTQATLAEVYDARQTIGRSVRTSRRSSTTCRQWRRGSNGLRRSP